MTTQIELVRKRRGLSRQAVANLLNTTGQTIYRLERGEQRVTTDWLRRLAEALEVEPAELLGEAEDAPEFPEPPREDRLQAEEIDWGKVHDTVLPDVETVDMFTMTGDALAQIGVLDGDHLMIDRKGKPQTGDVVVVELFGATRQPQKIARLYDPPYLISYSLDAQARRPILLESAQVRLIGVVRGVMRLK